MIQFDENFLREVGLEGLPKDQQKPFLEYAYSELESRVGDRLSQNLSDDKLSEFSDIVDGNNDVIVSWLTNNCPDYKNDAIFVNLKNKTGLDENSPSLRNEFASSKWLTINCPGYKMVVLQTIDGLKKEIASNKDAILGEDNR